MKHVVLFTCILISLSSCNEIKEKALEGRWECLEVTINNWSDFENAYLENQQRLVSEVIAQDQLYLIYDGTQLQNAYNEGLNTARNIALLIKGDIETAYKNRVFNLNPNNSAIITVNNQSTSASWHVSKKYNDVFIGNESFSFDSKNLDRMTNTKSITIAEQIGEEQAAEWAKSGLAELLNIKLEIKVIMELR